MAFATVGTANSTRAYEITGRWSRTATNGNNTGSQGTPVTVTWGFVPDNTTITGTEGSSGSTLISFLKTHIGTNPNSSALTDQPWFTIFDSAYMRLGEVSGMTFVYEPNNTSQAMSSTSGFSTRGQLGVRPDVRIGGHSIDGQSGQNTLAYSYFPDHSDMVIDTDNIAIFSNSASNYLSFRNVIMHEAGHGLGFSHLESNSAAFLMEPIISTAFDGPQLDDILALQRNYGDAWEKNGGNNTFGTSVDLGSLTENSSLAIGTLGDSTSVLANQTDFLSINDNSDTDYFQFTLNNKLEVKLDLIPRGATYNEAPQSGTQMPLNTKSLSDLTLTLLDINGTTVLDMANANGLGGSETITRILNAGTYFARVNGADNEVQLYGLDVFGFRIPANLIWIGQQSDIWDVSVTANFEDGGLGAVFNNSDHVTFDDTASSTSVNIAEDVQPGSVSVNTASIYTFTGPGAITTGSLALAGGGTLELANDGNSYSGNTDVLDGTLVITGDANTMVSPITVTLGSTVVMDSLDASSMGSTFHIEAGGTLQIGTLTSDANVFPDQPGSILNDGDIRVFDDETLRNVSGIGRIIVENETTFLGGNPAFAGAVIVNAGGIIDVNDSDAFGTTDSGTTVHEGGSILFDRSVIFDELLELAGEGTGTGVLRVSGDSSVELLGDITLRGSTIVLRVETGSALQVNSTVTSVDDGILTLHVEEGGQAILDGSFDLRAGGLVKQGAGIAQLMGQGNYTGATEVQAGALTLGGATGTGDTTVHDGALLTGSGTIGGNLIAEDGATIHLGSVEASALLPEGPNPSLLVAGDYSQSAAATLKIILNADDEYEKMFVTGAAYLDGVLDVQLATGLSPMSGDLFEVLTAGGNVKDEFASILLPDLGTLLAMNLIYELEKVSLIVTPALAGDFDVDGDVDGSDFLAWQRGSSPFPWSQSDLSDWQTHYGEFTPFSVTSFNVPEPMTGSLSVIYIAALIIGRRTSLLRT